MLTQVERTLLDHLGQRVDLLGAFYDVQQTSRFGGPHSPGICWALYHCDDMECELVPFEPHLHFDQAGGLHTLEPHAGRLVYTPTGLHLDDVEFLEQSYPWKELFDRSILLLPPWCNPDDRDSEGRPIDRSTTRD
jgi:hypothetical protein